MNLSHNLIFMEEEGALLPSKERRSYKKVGKSELFSVKRGDSEIYYVKSERERALFQEGGMEIESLILRALRLVFKELDYKKGTPVLVVGVGNRGLVADSLGVEALKHLKIVCSKTENILCGLAPSVKGVTGIESYRIVKSVVEEINPALIICIDTLATKSVEHLSSLVQISPNGIIPGAGVNNSQKPLTKETLGVPVVAVGVPLVIYAKEIVYSLMKENAVAISNELQNLVMTSKEVDFFVDSYARIIGSAINGVIYGNH